MCKTTSGKALFSWREQAIAQAKENSIEPLEVDWLLQGCSDLTSLSLRLGTYQNKQNIPLKISLFDLKEKWQARIAHRIPVQYLTGETPWRNLFLTVSPDVLIPRPETELIIDIAAQLVDSSKISNQLKKGHWADLGTGSGAIALGLAHQFPTATIHAVDISQPALVIAQQNAQQNQQATRITFHQGSWLSPLTPLKGNLAAIISNPPYIPTKTVLTLQPEVSNHEPHLALDGGPDGLRCIQELVRNGIHYLQPGGLFLIELMQGQAPTVADLLAVENQYTNIVIHTDLSGIQRFVSASKAL